MSNLFSEFVDNEIVEVFVARQAIFDRNRRVHGYELLFRSSAERNECEPNAVIGATAAVIANSLFAIGLDNLRDGKSAFVNFDREMLLQEWYNVLPSKTTVVEILETVSPDAEVVSACRQLARQGYRIALDDFVLRDGYETLLDIAHLLKVEIESVPKPQQEAMLHRCHARGLKLVAEKVETYEQFEWAHKAGYDFFQGYFFARPVVMRGHQIPPVKLNCLRLLRETHQAELDFDRLARLISEDVALSYKLIRYASSALFARRAQIRSVRQALVTLGENNIRRWGALITLSTLGADKPGELISCSLIRARFCELLGQVARPQIQAQAFLMGLFSLLDALLDRPLHEALAEVCLAPSITAALLSLAPDDDLLSRLYRLARSYEAADWQEVDRIVDEIGTSPDMVRSAYVEAVQWAREALIP
jgi:EAL and modified HD-GYP domain-containing signal transduction protein